MKNKKLVIFGAVLLSIVILVIFFVIKKDGFAYIKSKPSSTNNQSLDKVNIRLSWVHQAEFAGVYVADQKGFFKDAGLDVSINPGGLDFPAIQMVAGGKEEFGIAEADQILLAREQGVPIIPLAIDYRKNPNIFFSLKKSGITNVKDFIGKRIGTKNENMPLFEAMLKSQGIKDSQMTLIPVEYDITPLLTGKVDVFPGISINEPIVAEENGASVNIIWPSDYGIKAYSEGLFTTEKMIEEKPDLVKRFTEAYLKGWNYAYDHVDEAVADTLLYDKNLLPDHETRMMKASLELLKPDDKPIGYMDEAGWQETEDTLVKNGIITNPPDISKIFGVYSKLFNN